MSTHSHASTASSPASASLLQGILHTDTALALSALLVAVSLVVLIGLRDRWLGGR